MISSQVTSFSLDQVEVVPGAAQKVITIVTEDAQEEIVADSLTSIETTSTSDTTTTPVKFTVTTEDADLPSTVTLIANEVEV